MKRSYSVMLLAAFAAAFISSISPAFGQTAFEEITAFPDTVRCDSCTVIVDSEKLTSINSKGEASMPFYVEKGWFESVVGFIKTNPTRFIIMVYKTNMFFDSRIDRAFVYGICEKGICNLNRSFEDAVSELRGTNVYLQEVDYKYRDQLFRTVLDTKKDRLEKEYIGPKLMKNRWFKAVEKTNTENYGILGNNGL
jgi:hypothetical protein